MIEAVYGSLARLWTHVWRHCGEKMSLHICIYGDSPLEKDPYTRNLQRFWNKGSGIYELSVSIRVTNGPSSIT